MEKRDEKREELLDAALSVLLKYGLRKATLEDIASKAGMATTSLYYYFKNKREIIAATAEREIGHIMAKIDEAYSLQGSLEERLSNIWLASFIHPLKNNIDIDDLIEVFSITRELIPRLMEHQDKHVKNLLREGIALQQLHIADLDLACKTVSFAMRGMGQALIQGEDKEIVIIAIQKLARLLIRGMQQPIEQQ